VLFQEIRSLQDVADLQNSISDPLDWCNAWNLKINPSKSSFLAISFMRNKIPSAYFIEDYSIAKVSSQKDVGI